MNHYAMRYARDREHVIPMTTMRYPTMMFLALATAAAVPACSKSDKSADKAGAGKAAEAGKHSCDEVEIAMRRIEPKRTADIRPGIFARLCRDKAFDQARIGCMVAAQSSDDLKICNDPSLAPLQPPAGATAALAWRDVPQFGAKLKVPGDVKIEQQKINAHLTNGTFKLNLFIVDEYSSQTAAAKKASLQKEPGFVKFTKQEMGDKTWRFDYELAEGKAGTSSRIDVGKPLDCGVHKMSPELAAAAGAACSGAKAL